MIEGAAQKILEKRFSASKVKEMMGNAAFDVAADIAFDVVFGANTHDDNSSSENEYDREDTMLAYNYAYEIQNMRFSVSERGYNALI